MSVLAQGSPTQAIDGRQGRRSWTAAHGLAPPLVLVSTWLAMSVAIDPRGDFSLNDDWAYGLPVQALVESGEIRFTFWQSMTLITQVLWGALFCLPSGFSFTALRISTLVAGLAGAFGLYGLLRHYNACRTVALVGALAFATNPLYLGLSCTFMTDVPFTTLLLISVLSLACSLESGRDPEIWLGMATAFAALFIRQLALAVFLGFLVTSPLKFGFGRKWLLRGALPLVIAGLSLPAYTRLLTRAGRLPGMYFTKAETLWQMLSDLVHR